MEPLACADKIERVWFFHPSRISLLMVIMFAVGCPSKHNDRESITLNMREQPFVKTERQIPKILDISDQDYEQIWSLAKLPNDEELGLSDIFHYLVLYSIRSEGYRKEIEHLISIIQDEETGKTVLGDPVFHSSKFGIAMVTGRTSRAQETHRDQGLAEFGLLGIPSTLEVKVDGRKRPLSDAIQECIANFYLQKRELAWSATVLALYLPPQREWTNRFGERCSFDLLVDELLKRRFEDNSCAGAHLLEVLMLIYAVSLEENILSYDTQKNLKEHLHTVLDVVLRGQHEEGYWRVDWFVDLPDYEMPFDRPHVWTPQDNAESRLLATAHLLDWMLSLPEEFDVPDQTLLNAGQWMLDHLKTKTPERPPPICPYGHAIRGLELLSRENP